jgi:hypothetical protein
VWKGYFDNKRKHIRIKCNVPLCSEVTIIKVNNKKVNTGKTKVCVEDIGAGGLRFISSLDLPVNPNFIVSFETLILKQELLFNGIIVRKQEINNGIFAYGAKFLMDDQDIKAFANVINDLDYVISKKIKNIDSNLCSKDRMECLLYSKEKTEKRAYIRFKCPTPLCSSLIVKRINNKIIDSQSDNICIEDIGHGGVSFLSHIDYPIIGDINYELLIVVLDLRILLSGQLVRKFNIEDNIFKYGLKFEKPETGNSDLRELLDFIKDPSSNTIWFKKSNFCVKDKMECLRSRLDG